MDPYERARLTRDAERVAIRRALWEKVPIPEIAKTYGMPERHLRCILRAMNAIATMTRRTS